MRNSFAGKTRIPRESRKADQRFTRWRRSIEAPTIPRMDHGGGGGQRHLGRASPEMARLYQRKRDGFQINLTKAAGLKRAAFAEAHPLPG
ncbi:hypothetical protein [Methylocystis silviterrae]|uniref:hypothetical protein n=1 Tax=Methylocystis silviterrae TaxID=2743612 RepID=UPI003C759FB0